MLSHIESGMLSAGHARTLVAADSPQEIAEQIIKLGLSVREAENLTRKEPTKPKAPARDKDADTRALERSLSEVLGLKVNIEHKEPGGTLSISYKNLDQLDDVSRRLQANSGT